MIIEASVVAELVAFARSVEQAFEAWNQGTATEEQIATLKAATDLKQARLFAKFDAMDARDAAAAKDGGR